MKKILIALAGVAAIGAAPQTTFAESVGAQELADTQELIAAIQADRRQIMFDTLALKPEQLEKFTPIYDEYQAEQAKLMTSASNLSNRLFVADLGGITNEESAAIMKDAFKLRHERLNLLEKTAGKLDKKLPATKVAQFVQVENKIMALLDVAAAASIPIVTKEPNVVR
jgi:Spy/CpxP family protein refolding chaperone